MMHNLALTKTLIPLQSFHVRPRVYVVCLESCYKDITHGVWIEATQSVDEIYAEIEEMLHKSSIEDAEEWAIQDYEGFGSYFLGEQESILTISEMGQFINVYGELGVALIRQLGTKDLAKDMLDNHYQGEFESELDFAKSLFDDGYGDDVPDNIKCFIDFESFKRDIFISNYFSIDLDYKVHVFANY